MNDRWTREGLALPIEDVTGLPLHEAFHDLCAAFVRRDFPKFGLAIDQAFDTLGNGAVTALALPNDCQGLMRAWTLVAKRTGTRSLVVQHGHLDYTEDEDHLVGDYSAFWSESVCRHYLSAGLERRQMVVTGSPNADVYLRRAIPATQRSVGSPTRVLVITTGNPGVQAYVDETWVVEYIVRVLNDLCDGSSRFDVAVRLHPGESIATYEEYVRPWRDQISALGDGGRLADWLSACDVVVTPPSTVVLEARACGLPVILLPIESEDRRPISLRHVRGVMTLGASESVAEAVVRIVTEQGAGRADGADLSEFVGPLDGDAALRLLRATERVALGGGEMSATHAVRMTPARETHDAVARTT